MPLPLDCIISTALKFETPCRGRYFLVQTRKHPKNLPKGALRKGAPLGFRFAVPGISCAHFMGLLLADRCTSLGSLSPPPAAVASFALRRLAIQRPKMFQFLDAYRSKTRKVSLELCGAGSMPPAVLRKYPVVILSGVLAKSKDLIGRVGDSSTHFVRSE